MLPEPRYRDEPLEPKGVPESLLQDCRKIGALLIDIAPLPPGYRLDKTRLASGVWLDFDGPAGPVKVQLAPKENGGARLAEAGGVLVRAAGDGPAVRQAKPLFAWLLAGLRAFREKTAGPSLPHLVAAAANKHHFETDPAPISRVGVRQAELRLLLACNQRCFFCNCDENAPNLVRTLENARETLLRLREGGAVDLVVTGGEPTLYADLVGVIKSAKAAGFERIGLQTNSMLLGEGSLAADLGAAGLGESFASLHGTSAETVDLITGTPGGFERTLRGIDKTLSAGIAVTANFVANRRNLAELAGFPDFVKERFSGRVRSMVLSFMSPVASAMSNLDETPRLSQAGPAFRAAAERAAAIGMKARIAGVCGVPLCQISGYETISDEYHNPEGVSIPADRRLGQDCGRCAFKSRCTGFWRTYLDKHGDSELQPRE